jgi:hypothetical protein
VSVREGLLDNAAFNDRLEAAWGEGYDQAAYEARDHLRAAGMHDAANELEKLFVGMVTTKGRR